MSLKRIPIRWKITILSFGIVLFAILIGAGLFQLDQKEEALNFVFETSEKKEKLSKFLVNLLRIIVYLVCC